MAKRGVSMTTRGWQDFTKQVDRLSKGDIKKIDDELLIGTKQGANALAYVMRQLCRTSEDTAGEATFDFVRGFGIRKGEARKSERLARKGVKREVFPKPLKSSITVRKIRRTAKLKYDNIGHRVTFRGRGYPGRASMLEFGHKKKNGGRTRAFPFVHPAKAITEPYIKRVVATGVSKGMKKEWRRIAKIIKASKKP